ncbi:MAG: DUF4388 domain-containing protein [Chloroflexota bacterium]
MALQGNLRDFSTTQLLNLVNLARKTGAMTIEADSDKASLYFREGKLIHASTDKREGRLADMLVFSGKLAEDQLQAMTRNGQSISDKALGIDLIKSGAVKQQDIVQSVKQFMLDIVYSLFSWKEGQFDFNQGAQPTADKITIPLNLDNVIFEGNRQLQEQERLLADLPDLSVVALQITDKPLRDVKLTPDDWRVISHIHPRHTIEQIAQANGMDEFQIRKIVYGMLQAGLVELIKPEGFQPKQSFQSRAGKKQALDSPSMKRSVVERLITRIKRI